MDNELRKIVGKQLMLIRKDQELSIESLADITHLAPSTISRYENGKGAMTLENLSKIITSCNYDISIFFNQCIAKMQKKQ